MRDIDLLVVGDANPDVLIAGAPSVLVGGQAETLVDSGTLALGGSAAIVAHGAARLGLTTALASMVGRDAAGDFVLDTLTAAGVDVSGCLRHQDLPTALTVCLNRPDGDRAILTSVGVMAAFDAWQVSTGLVDRARHVHAASLFLLPRLTAGLSEVLAHAVSNDSGTSIDTNADPAGAWKLSPELLASCDFVLPNEAEALALAGADDLAAAMRYFAGTGTTPVVKRGGQGAVALSDNQWVVGRPPLVSPVVDTVGAGDGFDAGFIAGWLAGGRIESALALGCACGAASTRAAGGTAAQLDAETGALAAVDTRIEMPNRAEY